MAAAEKRTGCSRSCRKNRRRSGFLSCRFFVLSFNSVLVRGIASVAFWVILERLRPLRYRSLVALPFQSDGSIFQPFDHFLDNGLKGTAWPEHGCSLFFAYEDGSECPPQRLRGRFSCTRH